MAVDVSWLVHPEDARILRKSDVLVDGVLTLLCVGGDGSENSLLFDPPNTVRVLVAAVTEAVSKTVADA